MKYIFSSEIQESHRRSFSEFTPYDTLCSKVKSKELRDRMDRIEILDFAKNIRNLY
jgi:hypothetical protein